MGKGLSMDKLASILGVTKSRISMWENNGVVPRDEVLLQLSNYFGVSTDYLLGNDSMEGQTPEESDTLHFLQRNLKELNEEQLEKAKAILSNVFDDIFNDEEE
jgi:transcriptional regulator with XRE-family HTH domain